MSESLASNSLYFKSCHSISCPNADFYQTCYPNTLLYPTTFLTSYYLFHFSHPQNYNYSCISDIVLRPSLPILFPLSPLSPLSPLQRQRTTFATSQRKSIKLYPTPQHTKPLLATPQINRNCPFFTLISQSNTQTNCGVLILSCRKGSDFCAHDFSHQFRGGWRNTTQNGHQS